jgi:hypothetical protein
MRKMLVSILAFCILLVGCDSVRFAPTEVQKQNAWLHNRTAGITAESARVEEVSEKLQALAGLSELQSRAFVSYYGLPREFPEAETVEDILAQSNFELARTALAESAGRPDAWDLADSALELAIGISALLGGVYGTRAVRFLREARAKSKALKEVIAGNELFKKANNQYASAFKDAQKDQSPRTRQIVAQMKS